MSEVLNLSDFEYVLKEVAKIWTPGTEAIRLKMEMKVNSLEETPAALKEAGYEVYAADLPVKVSGVAAVVDGRRYILVNRDESRARQQFTIAHELGHHVLHLNPTPEAELIGFAKATDKEFQADQFAAVWHVLGTEPKERKEILRRNPRAGKVLTASVVATILLFLVPVICYVFSRLFGNKAASEK